MVFERVSQLLLDNIDAKIQEYSKAEETKDGTTRLYSIVIGYVMRLDNGRFLKRNGKVSETRFYEYARIDKSTWSEMKRGTVVTSKKTLLKLIIALELDEAEATALLQVMGSGFYPNDPQDQVVQAIIDLRKNGFEITVDDAIEILYDYSQIGSKPFVSIYESPNDKKS